MFYFSATDRVQRHGTPALTSQRLTSLDKQTERQLQVQAEIIDIVRKMKDLAHKHLDDHRGRQAHPPQGHGRHGRHAGPGAAEVYPEISKDL